MGGVQGMCNAWKRACLSDEDCRHGICSKDNLTICASDADCAQDLGICFYSGGSCSGDSDCPAQSEICSATQVACDANRPCASVGTCKYGMNVVCRNPGGSCPTIGTCSTQASRTCQQDGECPLASRGGSCSRGSTAVQGCSQERDCPASKRCAYSGETCRSDNQCPLFTFSICDGGQRNGRSCNSASDCGGGRCMAPPANPCIGTPNLCVLPGGTCNLHTDNRCTATPNICSSPTNTCTLPSPNACQTPASLADSCVPSPAGTPGPIRMCKGSQRVCTRNSDCGGTDLCGPATSRAVMVKRALIKLVMDNYPSVNFGLMTFYQDGYFPYFQTARGDSSESVAVFRSKEQLRRAGCYTWDQQTLMGGPSATCNLSGRELTLRPTADSRYRVQVGQQIDVDFCGEACDMPNRLGLGTYLGSTYQVQRSTLVPTTTLLERHTYDGRDITVAGLNYSYYKPLANTYNGGHAPPISVANCGSTCSATCGGRWDVQLAPFIHTSDDPQSALAAAHAITARMDYASDGGLLAYWGTPTGCTLDNDVAHTPFASAYHYMNAVKNGFSSPSLTVAADPVTRRSNSVLLITDGAPNGPGDVDGNGNSLCDQAPCSADDPVTAGCPCRSVLAAYRLRHNLGVTVFVVGFSGDAPTVSSNNIARAGGSGAAHLATSEGELDQALQLAIASATRGKAGSHQ
jgi:hypothetical protein